MFIPWKYQDGGVRRLLRPAALAVGLCLAGGSAWAASPVPQNCDVPPQQGGEPQKAAPVPPAGGGNGTQAKTDRCKGVLNPPAVGDHDMVKPAPDVGKMPVIPPSAVPKDNAQPK